ncbi:UDP-N-acetylmuramyl pentapeptide phosphotransferase/UDP-N-acetylglucosamine-1-phosphate transferase [Pseudomonas sp. TE6283]
MLHLVWLLNLYNFMDGIAGVEAVSICLGVSLI